MRISVTVLRDQGRILKNDQLPNPVVGNLTIEDWPPMRKKGRWSRRADLRSTTGASLEHDLLTPIFDPQIMRVDETGMYLQGVQRYSENGGETMREFVQVWRCVPA